MLLPASNGAQLVGGRLAGPLIISELIRQLLAFVQVRHLGALDRADVNEHILAAIIRLNEAKTLLRIEPFDSSGAHALSFRLTRIWQHSWQGCRRWSKFRGSSSVRRRAVSQAWPSRSAETSMLLINHKAVKLQGPVWGAAPKQVEGNLTRQASGPPSPPIKPAYHDHRLVVRIAVPVMLHP